jgi:hypothetical protein
VALAGEPAGASSRITLGPVAGRVAVGTLILATFVIVAAASSGPSILVPRSVQLFPNWEAGPLHVIPRLITNPDTVGLIFSCLLVVMLVAYAAALAAVRSLSMRMIAVAVVALHLILVLSPPMQLTDLFNYVGYARLGALHHLNPYTHVIRQELFDPVYGFSSWHNLRSPYGPLFLALTYPLALVSLPIAYWAIKLATVALSLAFVALIWQIARQLGRDPRFPVAFVALNPVFLIYAVEGFHNDFFMLVPMLGAISLALLTDFSFPNLFGLILGVGGTPFLLKLAAVGVVLVVAYQYFRNSDWIAGAGWSTLALIASLSWLMPWYIVWLLPLAALATSIRLRRVAVALTVYAILVFVPTVNTYMNDHGINLLNTAAGRASTSLQYKLGK